MQIDRLVPRNTRTYREKTAPPEAFQMLSRNRPARLESVECEICALPADTARLLRYVNSGVAAWAEVAFRCAAHRPSAFFLAVKMLYPYWNGIRKTNSVWLVRRRTRAEAEALLRDEAEHRASA